MRCRDLLGSAVLGLVLSLTGCWAPAQYVLPAEESDAPCPEPEAPPAPSAEPAPPARPWRDTVVLLHPPGIEFEPMEEYRARKLREREQQYYLDLLLARESRSSRWAARAPKWRGRGAYGR